MRWRIVVLMLIALAGCNRYSTPGYDIPEQKVRGRERFAISEDDYRIGPRGFIDRPSPIGR